MAVRIPVDPLATRSVTSVNDPEIPPRSAIAPLPPKAPVSQNTRNSAEDTSAIIFPPILEDQVDRPCIEFTPKVKGDKSPLRQIWLPCPSNIVINDQAQYNTIDLGTMGGAIAAAAQAGSRAEQGGGMSAIANSIKNQATNLKGAEIAALGLGKLPFGDQIATQAKFAARVVTNPNTNTTFASNGIRTFSFSFNMIATSEEEARLIRRLHNRFRTFSYADSRNNSQNIILEYPPVWTIKFLDKSKKENPFIPKIYSCYLQSVQVTLNSGTYVFHTDGAPLEVEMQLQFQETRALTRQDILNLEQGLLPNRGVDQLTGMPSVQGGSQPERAGEVNAPGQSNQTQGGT